jgi:A/G-specific adenine glycosylase
MNRRVASDGTAAKKPKAINAMIFRRRLMAWYRKSARALPWRKTSDPYAIWVSEIMLQQTRVAAVIDYYNEFLRRFPTLVSLALATEAEVLAAWSGLGYYNRARMLHKAAQFIVSERKGQLPATTVELRSLPGVGEYTAAAIASIAFGECVAVVDGNVERVILRLTGQAGEATAAARTAIRAQAQMLMPPPAASTVNAAGEHNQAMMELGATICLPRKPLCESCPVKTQCATRGEHLTPPRTTQRSLPAAYLLDLRKRGASTEVLLERRPKNAAVMPAMYELPTIPTQEVEGLEPALRLRHSITNTNYYVQVFSPRRLAPPGGGRRPTGAAAALRATVPTTTPGKLRWMRVARLAGIPLTGLARKILLRLQVMENPHITIDE